MKKDELQQRAFENTTIAELLDIINNNDIVTDSLEDASRIRYIKLNIKSIMKSIIKSSIDIM